MGSGSRNIARRLLPSESVANMDFLAGGYISASTILVTSGPAENSSISNISMEAAVGSTANCSRLLVDVV